MGYIIVNLSNKKEKFMSAATEDLLLQIFEIETLIQEKTSKGCDVTDLNEKLFFLRQKLDTLNENLKNVKHILKG
jgi:hypothetical protein